MDGILPLWKPKGLTSHDCVMKIRKLYQTRKVGHTGTLDPEVEGVLGICIGKATKIVPYLTSLEKTYIAECSLGAATETEDATGKVINEVEIENPPTANEIEAALKQFRGDITQIPPMYSAVRVNGKRLYEYARANEEVERPLRNVHIHNLIHLDQESNDLKKFAMEVTCSAGTYIRTLCVDIGKELGYPAHMSSLVRTEASSFSASETVTFADVESAKENNREDELLVPIVRGLQHMDKLEVDQETKKKVGHGRKLPTPSSGLKTNPFLIMSDDELLAIYQIHPDHPNEIKPVRVFME